MIYSYPGCFFQTSEGKYCVVLPDFDNTAVFGENFDTALANSVAMLAKCIYSTKMRNEKLPAPSLLSSLKPDVSDGYIRAFLKIINVDAEEYAKEYFEREVTKTVTVPIWIDDIIKKENIDLSDLIKTVICEHYNYSDKISEKIPV